MRTRRCARGLLHSPLRADGYADGSLSCRFGETCVSNAPVRRIVSKPLHHLPSFASLARRCAISISSAKSRSRGRGCLRALTRCPGCSPSAHRSGRVTTAASLRRLLSARAATGRRAARRRQRRSWSMPLRLPGLVLYARMGRHYLEVAIVPGQVSSRELEVANTIKKIND